MSTTIQKQTQDALALVEEVNAVILTEPAAAEPPRPMPDKRPRRGNVPVS